MILTRGARVTGAVLCAVLALIVAGWIVRDINAADDIGQLGRRWAGFYDARFTVLPTTSVSDPVLLVVYAAAAVAALRSAASAGALAAAGAVTIAVRLPGLWNIGEARWDGRFPDELRTRAMICAFVALAAGIALIITAGAGRRPVRDFTERPPARPGTGAGVVVLLGLGAAAVVVAGWEIRQALRGPDLYPDWYLGGDRVFQPLTGPPPGWFSALLVLLCLFAGVSAVSRATHARAFGLIAAALLLLEGILSVIRTVHYELLQHFLDLPVESELLVLTGFFEVFVGAVTLLAAALPGRPAPVPAPGGEPGYGPGYGPPPGPFGPPPPSQPPPGW
ncbi:hypothetical protein ACFCV8_19275 [Streptomyces sp. NPDC056347]|uniref:hypothetical protein n=1 Tax=Streptomyces sp. NPDC056347 TaxID=3345790 RepID=UPI0035DC5467